MEKWINSLPGGVKETTLRRRSAFNRGHVPNWFRLSMMKRIKQENLDNLSIDKYHTSGNSVLIEFVRRFTGLFGFRWMDHHGSYGDSFVSQPYLELDKAKTMGSLVALATNSVCHVDEHSEWSRGCVWMQWSKKPKFVEFLGGPLDGLRYNPEVGVKSCNIYPTKRSTLEEVEQAQRVIDDLSQTIDSMIHYEDFLCRDRNLEVRIYNRAQAE